MGKRERQRQRNSRTNGQPPRRSNVYTDENPYLQDPYADSMYEDAPAPTGTTVAPDDAEPVSSMDATTKTAGVAWSQGTERVQTYDDLSEEVVVWSATVGDYSLTIALNAVFGDYLWFVIGTNSGADVADGSAPTLNEAKAAAEAAIPSEVQGQQQMDFAASLMTAEVWPLRCMACNGKGKVAWTRIEAAVTAGQPVTCGMCGSSEVDIDEAIARVAVTAPAGRPSWTVEHYTDSVDSSLGDMYFYSPPLPSWIGRYDQGETVAGGYVAWDPGAVSTPVFSYTVDAVLLPWVDDPSISQVAIEGAPCSSVEDGMTRVEQAIERVFADWQRQIDWSGADGPQAGPALPSGDPNQLSMFGARQLDRRVATGIQGRMPDTFTPTRTRWSGLSDQTILNVATGLVQSSDLSAFDVHGRPTPSEARDEARLRNLISSSRRRASGECRTEVIRLGGDDFSGYSYYTICHTCGDSSPEYRPSDGGMDPLGRAQRWGLMHEGLREAHQRRQAGETATTCSNCGQTYFYDPKNHRCPGEWEQIEEDAGVAPMVDPYAGMSWVEEQMAKQYGPKQSHRKVAVGQQQMLLCSALLDAAETAVAWANSSWAGTYGLSSPSVAKAKAELAGAVAAAIAQMPSTPDIERDCASLLARVDLNPPYDPDRVPAIKVLEGLLSPFIGHMFPWWTESRQARRVATMWPEGNAFTHPVPTAEEIEADLAARDGVFPLGPAPADEPKTIEARRQLSRAAKIDAITRDVLVTNPQLPKAEARRIARTTYDLYLTPKKASIEMGHILTDEEKAGLREVDATTLKVGDRIFNPGMGNVMNISPDGSVNFGQMGFAPIDGAIHTIESVGDGMLNGNPIPPGAKLLKMANQTKTAGIMDYYDVIVLWRGDEAPMVVFETADLSVAVAKAQEYFDGGDATNVYVQNRGSRDFFWKNGVPNADARFARSRRG